MSLKFQYSQIAFSFTFQGGLAGDCGLDHPQNMARGTTEIQCCSLVSYQVFVQQFKNLTMFLHPQHPGYYEFCPSRSQPNGEKWSPHLPDTGRLTADQALKITVRGERGCPAFLLGLPHSPSLKHGLKKKNPCLLRKTALPQMLRLGITHSNTCMSQSHTSKQHSGKASFICWSGSRGRFLLRFCFMPR